MVQNQDKFRSPHIQKQFYHFYTYIIPYQEINILIFLHLAPQTQLFSYILPYKRKSI